MEIDTLKSVIDAFRDKDKVKVTPVVIPKEKAIQFTREITAFFQRIAAEMYCKPKITVDITGNTCTIHLSKEYQGLEDFVTFANLKWLSDLLKTDNINLDNEDYSSGCQTCDYGSSHEVDIICSDIQP